MRSDRASKDTARHGTAVLVLLLLCSVVSERRNKNGAPYIIHHNDPWQTAYEQDILEKRTDIVGHYRISK